jgi:drug/metabolite transporter, DME family
MPSGAGQRTPVVLPVLQVLAAATLFGTTGTAAAFAPAAATPVGIGAARLVIGGAALLAALPLLGGRYAGVAALWRTPWAVAAGAMTAAYQLAFFAGVELAGVALATLITIGSGPVLVGLLSLALLGERPARAWWLATATCVIGIGLLNAEGAGRPAVDPFGLLLALGAGLAYALYTVGAKRLLADGAPSAEVMAAAFGLGAVLMVPVLLASGLAWLASVDGVAVALWLGLATTTLAYVLFGRGLRWLEAAPTATLVLAEPLVATALGVALLGETMGMLGWLGALLVGLGIAWQAAQAARAPRPARRRTLEA